MTRLQTFLLFFTIQFVNFGIWVLDVRFVSQANYTLAVISDALYCTLNFALIRKIAQTEETWTGYLGYTLGGVAGTIVGIWLSKLMTGK